jgi:hypothetical protein
MERKKLDIIIDLLNIKNDQLHILLEKMQLQNENVEDFDQNICAKKKCLFFFYFHILIELVFSGSFFLK